MSATRSGVVLVLCAPSGTGKTTLIKRLQEEFPNFGFSVSYTTRQPREGEVDKKDYHFIGVKEFKEKRESGFFAEWATVHGNYYGTPLKATLEMLEQGQDLIFDVDVQGASQLRLSLPDASYVFILPPSMDTLKKRLVQRASNTSEQIEQRLANAVYEMREARWFDYWVINDDLEKAYNQLRSVYTASTLSPQKAFVSLESILEGYLPKNADLSTNE